MKAVIDRIEDGIAVLLMGDEGKIRVNFPLFLLPAGSKESDILSISIERDPQAAQQTKERVSGLIEKLKKKSEGKSRIIQDPEG